MKRLWRNIRCGWFFSKQDIDYTNWHRAIGIRLSWKEHSFHDVYFYPKPQIISVSWGNLNKEETDHA